MELRVTQGESIRLPADFYSGDKRADPTDPRVTIFDAAGKAVVKNAVPVRDGVGSYRYDYPVTPEARPGTWKAVWTAKIAGRNVEATDDFEVVRAAASPTPAAARPKTKDTTTAPEAPKKPKKVERQVEAGAPAEKEVSPRRPGRRRLLSGRPALILGALALILLAIWLAPRRNDTVEDKIEQGVAAQKAGRGQEAEKLYREALASDPDNKLANFNLGVAAHSAGRLDEAERNYRAALDADPNFLPAMFNMAILQEQLGNIDDSETMYRRIVEEYPDSAPAHLNLGFLLVQRLNRPEDGKAEFARAVELDPALASRIPPDMRPASPGAPQPQAP